MLLENFLNSNLTVCSWLPHTGTCIFFFFVASLHIYNAHLWNVFPFFLYSFLWNLGFDVSWYYWEKNMHQDTEERVRDNETRGKCSWHAAFMAASLSLCVFCAGMVSSTSPCSGCGPFAFGQTIVQRGNKKRTADGGELLVLELCSSWACLGWMCFHLSW